MTKVVLFDLDGTLLPMDFDVFVKAYFGGVARKLAARGYEPQKLVASIWQGTKAMVENDGKKTNEAVFWDEFAKIYGEQARADEPYFDAFYREDFDKLQAVCGYNPSAAKIVKKLKAAGVRVALATNPVFPAIATGKRIAWAGLSHDDFELYTTYENSRYCKPNLAYYQDVVDALGVTAEECVMVGNDVSEDMVAEKLGMKVFLLTDCLINRSQADIGVYPQGDFEALEKYLENILK